MKVSRGQRPEAQLQRPKEPPRRQPERVLGELIQRCWSQTPRQRPTFTDVVAELEALGPGPVANPISGAE
jgi:hypothetical protein|eukprot:SAG25_NODE_324_length_9786_cov_33.460308_4_plen_70_part_00